MTHIKVKPDLQDNIYSSEYYNMYNARDFYKGTAFRMNEWTENTHYFHDVHIIDFVSFEGCLLYCLQSHLSTEYNKPVVITENNVIVGIEPSIYWHFIMGNNGKGEKGDTGSAGTISIGNVTTGNAGSNVIIENVGTAENAILNFTIPKGDPGEKGIQGEPGKTPILSATIDNVTSTEVAAASVQLENDIFKFTFDLPKGEPGQDGTDGINGLDGTPGADGSGYEYIYKLVKTEDEISLITAPESLDQDDYIPEGWTDNPSGISLEYPYEITCVRKKSFGTTEDPRGHWGVFIGPSIWSKWGVNGKDGDGVEYIFIRTNKNTAPDTPVASGSAPEELPIDKTWGSWTDDPIGVDSDYRWEWVSQRKWINNHWEPFSTPALWAYYSKDGQDGTIPNYNTYVYIQSDTQPQSKPEFNTPQPPEDSQWKDIPTGEGQWWQCIGKVDGKTNTVFEWGTIIPVNGKDGIAQDGKYTEFRFAKSTSKSTPPSLDNSIRIPSGWELDPPTIQDEEFLWMIVATILPNNTLNSPWSTPVCISGEKGNQGEPGPAGNPGISGTPGINYEIRFAVGTESGPNKEAASADKSQSVREPEYWSITYPANEISEDNPIVWFIQNRIIYSNNEDKVGTCEGPWSDFGRYTGEQGPAGSSGKDGQIVYPAGLFSTTTTYQTTEEKAPYVFVYNTETSSYKYYLLNKVGSYNGQDNFPDNPYPWQHPEWWEEFTQFKAIYSDIGIFGNALVGSAVFNKDYMFSQAGIDQNGDATTNYDNFNPEQSIGGTFTPNILLDFKTGDGHLGAGQITFKGNTISTGNITIGENATFGYEYITNGNTINKLHATISSLQENTDFTFAFIGNKQFENKIYDGVVINQSTKIVTITGFTGMCSNFNQLATALDESYININSISLYPQTTLNYYFIPNDVIGGVFIIGNVSDFQMVGQTGEDTGNYQLKSKGPDSPFSLPFIAVIKLDVNPSKSLTFQTYPKDMKVNATLNSGAPHAQHLIGINIDGWKWGGKIHALAMQYNGNGLDSNGRIVISEDNSTQDSLGLFIDPNNNSENLDNWTYSIIAYLFALPLDIF